MLESSYFSAGGSYDSDMYKVNEGMFITELFGKKKVLDMKKELFRGATEVHTDYLY